LKITADIPTPSKLIPFLAQSLNLVTRLDVGKCIRMVPLKLFPKAQRGMDLSLKEGMHYVDPLVEMEQESGESDEEEQQDEGERECLLALEDRDEDEEEENEEDILNQVD
jgi:hypothetical protein